MSSKVVQIEVAKETHEAAAEIAAFVAEVKIALADGWQPTQDGIALAVSAMGHLTTGLQGVAQIPGEFTATPGKAILGVLVELVPAVVEVFR